MEPMELKGQNGTLVITDAGVTIKKGLKGFFLGGGKDGRQNYPLLLHRRGAI